MNPGDPNELVRIDAVFTNETWALSKPMLRWEAEMVLDRMVKFDQQPWPGLRVWKAVLVPWFCS